MIVTSAARPDTVTTPLSSVIVITSSPLVALMMTVSAWPSPTPLPGVAARSMSTCLTSVPVRSLTVMVSAPPRALKLMVSTPLRSMVMLPTSRVSVARPPLAEMSMFSLTLAPLNSSVSLPRLALDRVAAVARIPDEGVVAGAEQGRVVAAPADDDVVAGAAGDGVVAVAAVDREVDLAGLERRGIDGVVAGAAVDDERVVGASAPSIVTCAASPLTTTDAPLLTTLMLSSPAVPLTVTVSASPSPWPLPGVADRSIATCVTSVPVRSLTVMVSAPPKALRTGCARRR